MRMSPHSGGGLLLALTASAAAGAAAAKEPPPKGHLEPWGSWAPGQPIEERADVPEPEEFHREYCTSDNGHGKPVVFRGAAAHMAAARWTTDEYLVEHYGKAKVKGVEYDIKETRAGGHADHIKNLNQFLDEYNTSDIYMVSPVPKAMKKDVEFLSCIRCGGYLKFLDSNSMWMGRGGSKSVIHYDDQDNINCMLAGKKRFVFMHPSYKEVFEAHPNSKKNRFGWVDTALDENAKGYGAFFGKIDVDRVDLIKYPGWKDVQWSYVDLEPGDCVYIPFQWYHQVTAHPGRSINVHVWYWRPKKFDSKSCGNKDDPPPRFSDCTWGYEPSDGGHLGTPKGQAPMTKCKLREDSRGKARTDL